jgi:opacity protein-like surface antigen
MKKLLAAALLAAVLSGCASAAQPTSGASGTGQLPGAPTSVAGSLSAGQPVIPTAFNGYKTVGKFFVSVSTLQFSCTAAVIGRNIIVTAAHCFTGVLSGAKYSTTGWMFAPMWHDNQFPYGKWSVRAVYLPQAWIQQLDSRFDYAVVVLNPNGGRDISAYTGQDSWNSSFSLTPGQSAPVRVVGIPLAGLKARISVTGAQAVQVGPGFTVLTASTPGFGLGTSGGPWFDPFSTKTGTGTIIGLTGGYQAGGATDSPSYADFLSAPFADLVTAAADGTTGCNNAGACQYWP